jgi:hypothetical protein
MEEIKMIIIAWDSLRLDAVEPLKGILGEESWTSMPSLDGFTGPILPAIVTGKSPEELGIPRTDEAFWSGIDPEKIDDTMFDHFDSHITVSRLIGPDTHPCVPLPPSRKGMTKFMPPINWNAVSNWDVDIWRYVGRKWSASNNDWWDVIFNWSFITHGNFTIYDSLGAKESPEIKNGSRLMARLAQQDPEKLRDLYMKGVYYAAETLKGLNEICGGKETIVCFSDHNEALGEEYKGRKWTGHFHGMEQIPGLEKIPMWVNRPDYEFPDDMTQLNIKDVIVDLYKKEKSDPEYQAWKKKCQGLTD